MSTVLGDLVVKYRADVSDLTEKAKSVKSELSSVGSKAEESGKSLKKTGEGAKEASGGFREMIKHGLEVAGVFTAFDIATEGVSKLCVPIPEVFKDTYDL